MCTVFCTLLVLACVLTPIALANVCRDTAACCQVFRFEAPSGAAATPYHDVTTVAVAAGDAGPWYEQGVRVSVSEVFALSGEPYALGLFNASQLGAVPAALPTGASHLHTPNDHLVLGAFEYYSTTLLRRTQTLHLAFDKQPACVAHVRTLRSIEFDYRQSTRVTLYRRDALSGDLTSVASQSALWSVSDTHVYNDFEFSTLHVDELKVELYGQGYGALAEFELCYASPQTLDPCGVCAGTGTGCQREGASCLVGGYAPSDRCAAGTLNAQLVCVSNMHNTVEQCNGVDDNCNGAVDEGPWAVLSCGVGACARNYSSCMHGEPVTHCTAGTPSAEVCNGVDDDCNGVIDDGNVCVSPSPSASVSSSVSASPSASSSASPSVSASLSASVSASFSASRSTSPSALPLSPSPSQSPTTVHSASTSLSLSASVSRSGTPSPLPSSIVAPGTRTLLPHVTCIRTLDAGAARYQAVFGYTFESADDSNREPVVIEPSVADNWLIVSPSIDNSDAWPQVQPRVFYTNTAPTRAFEVMFTGDEQVQWRLRYSNGTSSSTARQVAIASRYASVPCDSDASYTLEPVQPLLQGCVKRVLSLGSNNNGSVASCTATFGYYNPNVQSVQINADADANAFAPIAFDQRQPRVFFTGLVHSAVTVHYDCSNNGVADLRWTLRTGSVTRLAIAAATSSWCV